jgi:ATP-dependent DNA ligase
LALRGGSETRFLSRNQNDLGKKVTEVRDSIAALKVQDTIIDGEIVALDRKRAGHLSVTSHARRRSSFSTRHAE